MSVSVVAESFFATRLIGTAFAYALLSRGLERLPASSAFSLSLLHPLTAGVLGFVAWAKRFTPDQLLGAVLVSCGVVMGQFVGCKDEKSGAGSKLKSSYEKTP